MFFFPPFLFVSSSILDRCLGFPNQLFLFLILMLFHLGLKAVELLSWQVLHIESEVREVAVCLDFSVVSHNVDEFVPLLVVKFLVKIPDLLNELISFRLSWDYSRFLRTKFH